MRRSILGVIMLASTLFAACGADVRSDAAADSTAVDHTVEIAGDKTRMADLMRQSYARGTFDDALAMAMQDSAFAHAVADIVKSNPALLASSSSAPQKIVSPTAARSGSSRSTIRSTSSSTRSSGDVLDKAERSAQQANQKIDQAARIKKQAEEAKRKIDDILH